MPLAALEAQIKRKVMSQYHTCPGINGQQRTDIPVGGAKQRLHQQHSRHAFQRVSQKGNGTGLFAQHPQGVGGTRVAAALGTDINTVHFSVNIRGLKQAKHVTDGHTDQTDHHCSFSFRSRMMNFSEVPPKPKASRIRFSRYLV